MRFTGDTRQISKDNNVQKLDTSFPTWWWAKIISRITYRPHVPVVPQPAVSNHRENTIYDNLWLCSYLIILQVYSSMTEWKATRSTVE